MRKCVHHTIVFNSAKKYRRQKQQMHKKNKDQMYDNEHREVKNEMMTVRHSNKNIDKGSKKRIHYRN